MYDLESDIGIDDRRWNIDFQTQTRLGNSTGGMCTQAPGCMAEAGLKSLGNNYSVCSGYDKRILRLFLRSTEEGGTPAKTHAFKVFLGDILESSPAR